MKKTQFDYWEGIYSSDMLSLPVYDNWLDSHIDVIKRAKIIVDLGCGNGVNTIFLMNQNINNIVACDFSKKALEQLKKVVKCKTKCFDMSETFPFKKESIDILIADLSLHYFDEKTTKAIIGKIFRTMKDGGTIFCRLNSSKEYIPSTEDIELEKNYYLSKGCTKRFFNLDDIPRYFDRFKCLSLKENKTNKYGPEKYLLEFIGRK